MIKINRLTVDFGQQILFNGLNLHIASGEKVALIGESGSGKSTLIHTLLGFIPRFKGTIYYDQIKLTPANANHIRQMTSWVPQDLAFTVFQSVKELFYLPFSFKSNKKHFPDKKEIASVFKIFEITDELLHRNIKEISGGQRQRIILASIVLLKKPYLFLDEPTSALNVEIKNKITNYILQLPVTVVAATHDPYFINKADRVIELP